MYDQWGPARIGASIVWNETKGSSDVVVAVLDTGIRPDHEDLQANIWINTDEIADNGIDDDENGWTDDTWGWDCDAGDNDPWDEGWYGNYHGSACAGVIAAVQDNGVGCTGIAPGVKVMALRIGFDEAYESKIVEAWEYARINGAAICSMSFGGTEYSEIMDTASADLWDNGNGVLLLASAGNSDVEEIMYPAGYDAVIAIGATIPFTYDGEKVDEQRLTSTGDLGYYWGSNYGDWLGVMGFGEKYITTNGGDTDTYYDGVNYDFFGGTSNACPMAAAVMALIRSYFPGETPQWCHDRLIDTADDLHTPGFDNQTGHGRIDALRAVYGPDRYAGLEDPDGFVEMDLPDAQVFDTIHDVQGNPYLDTQDLYRFTAVKDGYLMVDLDIFTWGEDLDIALYSDRDLTDLVAESTGPNHADSSTESIFAEVTAGKEFFLKVYSAGAGNSTVYGLRVFNTTNELTITADSIAPGFIHQQGQDIPFVKFTLDIGIQATLQELIISKHGTLPNAKWVMARLYRDSNSNGSLDQNDELLIEKFPQAMNRVRLDGLDVEWNYHEPLVLFFTVDIGYNPDDCVVSFALESYKDVTTEENCIVAYSQFPVTCEGTRVGTDTDPPEWVSTVGIQSAEGFYNSAILGWNEAIDILTPPVKYNVYYTNTLPFVIKDAVKVADVPANSGTTTDYKTLVWGLPSGEELHFVIRAEDQAGNEDDNLVIKSCTPSSGGDPSNPMVIAEYPLSYPLALAGDSNKLIISDFDLDLLVYSSINPLNIQLLGTWNDDYVMDLTFDGNFAYCIGYYSFSVVNVVNPPNIYTADYVDLGGVSVGSDDDWAYVGGYYSNLTPVDIKNPFDLHKKTAVALPYSGYPVEIEVTPHYIYVANYGAGICVLDRADPASPVLVNTFGSENVGAVISVGDVLYAGNYANGTLYLYDIGTNPTSPPLLDSSADGPPGETASIAAVGDYIYVSKYDWGLVVFDCTDLHDIKLTGTLYIAGAQRIISVGPIIYVLTDNALKVVV
jgi:hypothetical protein